MFNKISEFLHLGSISQDVLDFCKVASGSSIITILSPLGAGGSLIQYIGTFLMWSAWTLTSLVGLKTLSGKKTVGEAFRYYKDLIFKSKKKEKEKEDNGST